MKFPPTFSVRRIAGRAKLRIGIPGVGNNSENPAAHHFG
jgi:hypothetical protein